MRVIAGTARGRRLGAPVGAGTRPTTDRVREATFNALVSLGAVEGARVLDAFAGSGALGIEALSRRASTCTFVERDRAARAVIEANLATTGLSERARVVGDDAVAHLARVEDVFDLVLFDPPRAEADWPVLLDAARARLGSGGVVVVEFDRAVVDGPGEGPREAPREASREGPWRVLREKAYGGTVVQMLSARPAPGSPA